MVAAPPRRRTRAASSGGISPSRSTETPSDISGDPIRCSVHNLCQRRLDVDDDAPLVGPEGLQRRQLRLQEGGRHEMIIARCRSRRQYDALGSEMHEDRVGSRDAQVVAVDAFEGRAGHDGVFLLDKAGSDRIEPWPPVLVAEWDAGRHLRYVRGGMQII